METIEKKNISSVTGIIGAFAIAAVTSLLLAKAFCQLAFATAEEEPSAHASLPSLNEPAIVLGSYRVKSITERKRVFALFTERTYNVGSICRPHKIGKEILPPHDNCGAIIAAVRIGDQLSLIKLKSDTTANDAYLESFLFRGDIIESKCDSIISLREARENIQNSRFCRATRTKNLDTRNKEAFHFFRNMDPLKPSQKMNIRGDAIANAMISFSMIGLPAGISSAQIIHIPKGSPNPPQITIKEITEVNILLLGSSTSIRTYVLERAGD